MSRSPALSPSTLFVLLLAGCDGCTEDITIASPGALYIGAYTPVSVSVGSLAPCSIDELEFSVPDGAAAGTVSLSRDDTFDAANPTVMLLAGYQPGTGYSLTANCAGTEVASTTFDVTRQWDYAERQGPPQWVMGATVLGGGVQGPAWGSEEVGVQNFETDPIAADATPRQIVVLLLEFTDYTFANAATEVNDWEDWVETGADSVNAYYQDLTGGDLKVEADVFGPYAMGDTWATFHTGTKPLETFYRTCVNVADADATANIDFTKYHSVVCVAASDPAGHPDDFTWPWGWGLTFNTNDGSHYMATVSMPEDWSTLDGRRPQATVCHELGHNLGLGDLYRPKVPADGADKGARNLQNWDVMNSEREMPFMSLGNRLRLGVVDPADVASLNPAHDLGADGQISEIIRLSPVEWTTPAAGHSIGVEFRLANGWNYLAEYRLGQAGQVGDQGATVPQAPGTGAVLLTDMMVDAVDAPFSRPRIIRLPELPLLLAVGDRYLEEDLHTGNALSIEVTDIDAGNSDVELWVRYGSLNSGIWDGASPSADPSIRKWPRSEEHPYQSPDIAVTNAVAAADPTYANVSLAGIPNTITAVVTNDGNLDATDVKVGFWVKDFNVGGEVAMSLLGYDTQDIVAGDSATFTWDGWQPDGEGHYCVVARIDPYDEEMSANNNEAQSNYNVVLSPTASPAERVRLPVMVNNPYDEGTWFYLQVRQTGTSFRTYAETTELWLEPGEDREINVMFEYAGDVGKERRETGTVLLAGYAEDPSVDDDGDEVADSLDFLGGAEVLVLNGWRTELADVGMRTSKEGTTVTGNVKTSGSGSAVTEGQVLVAATSGDPAAPDWSYARGELDSSGGFDIYVEAMDALQVKAWYLGGESTYGMSETEWLLP